ncbi:hypothetical protein [Thermococcus aciditolerans]|uniref:DsrE family protein n=1 Tax=Thermococcus aciditolerans TaxID=2598455 RepID=A0A5C0SHX8_9EURY|nr:hypothetical protein [Thermococcus aciditolerans]QEK14185.1 hypothetical protein FPV09_02625 [Thermococcus aciditolerans]
MKALVIISSADERAIPGFMWAVNAIKNGWAEDVEVILFGPIEDAVARGDERFVPWMERLRELGKLPTACRRIAEEKGFEDILGKHAKVEYVGAIIAELIEEGYVPMTF